MLVTYRASAASDYFWDGLNHKRHYEAVFSVDGLVVGSDFVPWTTLASVAYGEISEQISSESFGTVVRLLVEDGATVRPGQDLIEVEHRPPTLYEYENEWTRARVAEDEWRKWERIGRSPFRSLRYALTGHY